MSNIRRGNIYEATFFTIEIARVLRLYNTMYSYEVTWKKFIQGRKT